MRSTRLRLAALGTVVALAAVLTGCASAGSSADVATDAVPTDCSVSPASADTSDQAVTGSIRVLAAASLTGVFEEFADQFEKDHPESEIQVSFGPSSGLVARIDQGAPADVLATADTVTMHTAEQSDDVINPVTFTCNSMTILVPDDNPKHIGDLADLARDDVRFVLCAAQVPCGRLGREVLRRGNVDAKPVGSAKDVNAVVAKVAANQVDAGIVYGTDAKAVADATDEVTIPSRVNVETSYPIAVTTQADDLATASAFVAYVRSAEAQHILASYGFLT